MTFLYVHAKFGATTAQKSFTNFLGCSHADTVACRSKTKCDNQVKTRFQTKVRVILAVCGLVFTAEGHVGSPAVFFDGMAGPYRAHVMIRPAEVIPGLADISVRVDDAAVERVTALPIKWDTGRKGAPP